MAMKLQQHRFHQGQTSQTNILIPKQGFTVHLDLHTTKTHKKQIEEKSKKKNNLQEGRDLLFMFGGFPERTVISQIQPTGSTCTLDMGSTYSIKNKPFSPLPVC